MRNYRYALSALLSDGSEYQMFFSLRRSGNPDRDLRLFVESAYPISPASRPRGPGIIRFSVLATKVLRAERIKHSHPAGSARNSKGRPKAPRRWWSLGNRFGLRLSRIARGPVSGRGSAVTADLSLQHLI